MDQSEETTLAEHVYQALRDLIRESAYPPGTVLSENNLAQTLGVGRTPVREAIVRLAHEGLLSRQSRGRGVLVNTLGLDDVRDLYEAREVLEVACGRKAAEQAPRELIDRLGEIVEQSRQAVEFGISWSDYRKLDGQFHSAIADCGGNTRISAMLASMFDAAILDPWFHHTQSIPSQTHRSVAEHTAIFQAIAAGDADRTEAAIREHAQSYRKVLAEQIFGPKS